VIGVAFTAFAVWAAWRWFGPLAGVFCGAVSAISPLLVNVEGDVLPDFMLGVVIFVGAVLLALAFERESAPIRVLIATGVTFGAAALVKPVGQAFLLVAVLPFVVWGRRGARGAAAFVAAFVVTISPWLIRNAIDYGHFRMSAQDGAALWLREFDWDRRPIPTDTADGRLAQRLYTLTISQDSGANRLTNTYEYVAVELMKRGYTQSEAMAFERRVALEAIRQAPRVYLVNTWGIGLQLLRFTDSVWPGTYGLGLKDAAAEPSLPRRPSFKLFSLDLRLLHIWTALSLAFLSILLLPFVGPRKSRAASLAFGVPWVLLTAATAATTFPDPRYAAQGVALIWVLGSAGAALVVTALYAFIQNRRWSTRRPATRTDPASARIGVRSSSVPAPDTTGTRPAGVDG
jgi:4-amino-4-deoxy-L-arabinose transferase-like glycosyltransferase